MGRPAQRTGQKVRRVLGLLRYGLGQGRVLGEPYPGLMHGLIFFSFVVFFIATSLVGIQMDLGIPLLRGDFYLFFEMVVNAFALLFLVGLGLAAFRRYVQRPDRLNIVRDDAFILGTLTFIALTGLSLEVMRLRGQQPAWAEWSWLGNALAGLFGPPAEHPPAIYPFVWWSHQLATFALIATLPYTKFRHIVTTPANILFRRLDEPGAIPKIEGIEETEEPLGVGSIEQFSWKQLLDGDACTECGRCQDECPAYVAGQPLSPKKLIMDLRDWMSEQPGALYKWQKSLVEKVPLAQRLLLSGRQPEERDLVGQVILDETLWSCTTCRACERACPVFIEQVSEIVDMRRYLALEEGRLPDTLAQALRNTERQGNPWGQPRHQRTAWAAGLDLPVMAEVGQADVLYWVGCAGCYDPRSQRVSQAMVQILRAANADFAILGDEESCHAEWARRAGEEYLYQVLTEQNVEILKQYRFNRIVTQCPHCYNTLKNEYPQFGGQWQVIHHTEFIQELIGTDRLALQGEWCEGSVVFHDSCYLGRYNGIYAAPREVLLSIPAMELRELDRSREQGFCCGGGGASMWIEHEAGQRVNDTRWSEILSHGASLAAVACPFCLIMLDAAATSHGEETPARRDIAEVVAQRLI
jgi:Fe-S oxidoreductase/nitrate reductase gamma subunit